VIKEFLFPPLSVDFPIVIRRHHLTTNEPSQKHSQEQVVPCVSRSLKKSAFASLFVFEWEVKPPIFLFASGDPWGYSSHQRDKDVFSPKRFSSCQSTFGFGAQIPLFSTTVLGFSVLPKPVLSRRSLIYLYRSCSLFSLTEVLTPLLSEFCSIRPPKLRGFL